MAETSDQATDICSHCDRAIPSSNIDLHFAHCSRNLVKCKVCSDMIPKKYAEEHYSSTHAPTVRFQNFLSRTNNVPSRLCTTSRKYIRYVYHSNSWAGYVSCSMCNETMEPEILAVHKGEKCPQRIATCDYCEFPLPAIDLSEHQEVCGNRTELCHLCNRYIRLREKIDHELGCTGVAVNTAETSRGTREPERDRVPRRRQPQEFSTKRLIITIAITGIAVLLGSFLFQRKQTNQLH